LTQSSQQNGTAWNYPTVGRWCITGLPQGWTFVEGFGLRRDVGGPAAVGCNITLSEDTLTPGETFTAYTERQKALIQDRFTTAQVAGPQPHAVANAEDARLIMLRHNLQPGWAMMTVQTYMQFGDWVGVITLTVPETWMATIRPEHDAFVKVLHVMAERPMALAA